MNPVFTNTGQRPSTTSLSPDTFADRVLPLELTPIFAKGALMEILAVNVDWTSRANQLYANCANIGLPSSQAIRESLWIDQKIMDGARECLSYECHDLRVVKIDEKGQLHVLVGVRIEPQPDQTGIETAPINGFWWSLGGRRQIAKSDSQLDGKFELVQSILLKAYTEAGILPTSVEGLFDLGIGRTEFPRKMIYVSKSATEDGSLEEKAREVTLKYPQRTINRNIVVLVNNDTVLADHTVDRLAFISADQYSDPHIRARFCEYEQSFLDAVFEGWALHRARQAKL